MTSTPSAEACIGCGRATQPGTALFSDRRMTRGEEGAIIFLCGDCNERAVSHFGRQPTERDMVQMAARGPGSASSSAAQELGAARSS